MSRWLAEVRRRPVRSLGPAAVAALAPKCGLCILAYLGIGAVLGFGGPETCGAAPGLVTPWVLAISLGATGLAFAGVRARRS
jgi:hypothetical protein